MVDNTMNYAILCDLLTRESTPYKVLNICSAANTTRHPPPPPPPLFAHILYTSRAPSIT